MQLKWPLDSFFLSRTKCSINSELSKYVHINNNRKRTSRVGKSRAARQVCCWFQGGLYQQQSFWGASINLTALLLWLNALISRLDCGCSTHGPSWGPICSNVGSDITIRGYLHQRPSGSGLTRELDICISLHLRLHLLTVFPSVTPPSPVITTSCEQA